MVFLTALHWHIFYDPRFFSIFEIFWILFMRMCRSYTLLHFFSVCVTATCSLMDLYVFLAAPRVSTAHRFLSVLENLCNFCAQFLCICVTSVLFAFARFSLATAPHVFSSHWHFFTLLQRFRKFL
jgi:hypothetical protein